MEKKSKLSILLNGIIKENPTFILVLGTCPTIAVTTQAFNGLGMGLCVTLVLMCSNIFISLLKKIIPDTVRIPCYIVVIATFVTIVQFLLQAFLPDLNKSLGVFIPLIVVNCIILGRAEMFANKNSVVDSAMDGIGMGLGCTLALTLVGTIREIIGSGTWMGITLTANMITPFGLLILAPGGFFVYGLMIAVMQKLTKGGVKRKSFDCEGCPTASACQNKEGGCN
ncbi:MAG: electron transport complex subunit E [Firmicutes bacterium]|nr:electron transport complex subunit E [Bacillota bacterium]MBR6500020.1 electron transport complex subunit E [Bacillota bacterium]